MANDNMLNQYFKDIFKTHKARDATEASYYSDLKKLLENFLKSKGVNSNITTQPQRIEAGIPDFTIRKGKELIGYIEAKDLSITDLETIEYTEQIKRYKEKLPNFILTNYFDFWLWRRDTIDDKKGRWVKKVRIGQPITLKLNTPPSSQKEKEFFELLEAFFNYYLPERKTAKSLAIELASRAHLLPSCIVEELNNNIETEIDRIYSAFKTFLISDLTKEDFADIYAQTIAYGLFTARLRYQGKDFNRFLAQRLIPKNIQILYDTFNLISHDRLIESLAWIIDDMATVLAHADIEKIKEELHREKGGDDPLMHFYETFLAEYDPKKRKARGVYYTPLPVVSYIARSVNILLKEKFDKKMGFASAGVTLLDPASGTLTFPANAIMLAKEEIDKNPIAGSWLQIVEKHILKNYYAFELLMAPYIIGHLKISLLLEDWGYNLQNGERFQLYLTNTLDLSEVEQSQMPFVAGLSEEAKKAKEVKEKIPVLVVMGNPPYSRSSSNIIKEGSDFHKLYESYKEKVRKEERNIQPLSDDYIKFLAFAHWKIKQTGKGVIGMITNNSYLDGLIHRDMRQKLAEDFDEIYILNLHGNSKRNEKTPEGGKDENVFDIQQGVGIIILVKKQGLKKKVSYFDLYGLREKKYEFLDRCDIKNTKWQKLELKEPNCFFVLKDTKGEDLYKNFISLKDVFIFSNVGGKPGDDSLLVGENNSNLRGKINAFIQLLKLDKNKARTEADRNLLRIIDKFEIQEENFISYNYRPFDTKQTYYDDKIYTRPVSKLKVQFNKENLALLTTKIVTTHPFQHVFISEIFPDVIFLSNRGSTNTYVFPLYLYGDEKEEIIINGQEKLNLRGIQHTLRAKEDKEENINKNIFNLLEKTLDKRLTSKEILYYIYAILYSNIYREKYNEFLKIDFPKIPFTKDAKFFYKLADLGKELVNLHLLKSEKLETPLSKFPVIGDNMAKERKYNPKEKRIYINEKQYFDNIEPEIWNYYIGGYQVLDKWLKDKIGKTGKTLFPEDVIHYLKIITSLKYTIEIQKEIDKLYPEIERGLI